MPEYNLFHAAVRTPASQLSCLLLATPILFFPLLNAGLCMSVTIEYETVLTVNLLGRSQIEAYCF